MGFPAACFAALWCLDTRFRAPEGLHSEPSTMPAGVVPSAAQRMPSMQWALGASSFHFRDFGLQQPQAQDNRQSQWMGAGHRPWEDIEVWLLYYRL